MCLTAHDPARRQVIAPSLWVFIAAAAVTFTILPSSSHCLSSSSSLLYWRGAEAQYCPPYHQQHHHHHHSSHDSHNDALDDNDASIDGAFMLPIVQRVTMLLTPTPETGQGKDEGASEKIVDNGGRGDHNEEAGEVPLIVVASLGRPTNLPPPLMGGSGINNRGVCKQRDAHHRRSSGPPRIGGGRRGTESTHRQLSSHHDRSHHRDAGENTNGDNMYYHVASYSYTRSNGIGKVSNSTPVTTTEQCQQQRVMVSAPRRAVPTDTGCEYTFEEKEEEMKAREANSASGEQSDDGTRSTAMLVMNRMVFQFRCDPNSFLAVLDNNATMRTTTTIMNRTLRRRSDDVSITMSAATETTATTETTTTLYFTGSYAGVCGESGNIHENQQYEEERSGSVVGSGDGGRGAIGKGRDHHHYDSNNKHHSNHHHERPRLDGGHNGRGDGGDRHNNGGGNNKSSRGGSQQQQQQRDRRRRPPPRFHQPNHYPPHLLRHALLGAFVFLAGVVVTMIKYSRRCNEVTPSAVEGEAIGTNTDISGGAAGDCHQIGGVVVGASVGGGEDNRKQCSLLTVPNEHHTSSCLRLSMMAYSHRGGDTAANDRPSTEEVGIIIAGKGCDSGSLGHCGDVEMVSKVEAWRINCCVMKEDACCDPDNGSQQEEGRQWTARSSSNA